MSAAAESGDVDFAEESLSVNRYQLHEQILDKVVIPVNGRSSVASSLSSVLDQSSDYDTPGTSMIVTPADSLITEGRSLKRPSRMSSNIISYQAKEPFIGKRKRLEVELMEADALLAQELQEQEYGEDQDLVSRPRRARNALVDDSEESLLSELSSEHSPDSDGLPKPNISTPGWSGRRRPNALLSQSATADVDGGSSQDEFLNEDEILEIPVPRNKRIKTNNRTSLRSRAARVSANKCITDRTSRGVFDSEDSDLSNHSDNVSLFSSDNISDASEDSEDADGETGDILGTENSLTTAAATSDITSAPAPSAIPATGRRGTGRRRAPSTQSTNATRGRRSWQRGAEDRVCSELPSIPHPYLRHTLGCKRAAEARESAS